MAAAGLSLHFDQLCLPANKCLPTLPCAGFMLDRPLVLLYSCLLQHPFQVWLDRTLRAALHAGAQAFWLAV